MELLGGEQEKDVTVLSASLNDPDLLHLKDRPPDKDDSISPPKHNVTYVYVRVTEPAVGLAKKESGDVISDTATY